NRRQPSGRLHAARLRIEYAQASALGARLPNCRRVGGKHLVFARPRPAQVVLATVDRGMVERTVANTRAADGERLPPRQAGPALRRSDREAAHSRRGPRKAGSGPARALERGPARPAAPGSGPAERGASALGTDVPVRGPRKARRRASAPTA